MQWLFVRGLIKNKGGVGLFQISALTSINQVIILHCGLPSCTLPKEVFLSALAWARREYIWKLIWKESFLIYLENWQGAPCFHRQIRNRIMNTFIIILENRPMFLVHFKKASPLTLLVHSFERRAVYWLLFCFESYHGIPYSYTGKVYRGWLTLC